MTNWHAGVKPMIKKTKSIADAEAKIEDLTTKIEEYTAASARLNTEIKTSNQRWQRIKKLWTKQLPFGKNSLLSSTKKKKSVGIHFSSESNSHRVVETPRGCVFTVPPKPHLGRRSNHTT